MQKITLNDVELIVKTMADVAIENERYFSDLDAAAGDADFGVSLATGFRAIKDQWDALDRSSISAFLLKVGMIITNHVGGCSGPIWGTCFLKAGLNAKGKESLVLCDIVVMLRAAIEGMIARGGAQLGDKTLLDAWAPAADVFEKWSKNGSQDFVAAFKAATESVEKSVDIAKDWVAKRGRQSYTGERSIGTVDPGMVAVAKMFESVTKALEEIDIK